MPIDRATLDEFVAKLNARRPTGLEVVVEAYEPPGAFTLSFPDRAMPEGQCIDQDFSEIQFALHEERDITTSIVSGEQHPDDRRYRMRYEVVEWD